MEKLVAQLVNGNMHAAFLQCWLLFKNNYTVFQSAEQATLNDPERHGRRKEQVLSALVANNPIRIRNLGHEFPLAWLQALDEYLHLRFGANAQSPPSRITIGSQHYFIHRRRFSRHLESVHARQSGHLKSWMKYHWIFPDEIRGIKINPRPSPSPLVSLFKVNNDELRIFISHFPDEISPKWIETDPPTWLAGSLSGPEKRWRSICQGLQEARRLQAQIVVFPELTICPELRQRVVNWMDGNDDHGFQLILPGSFHQEMGSGIYNLAELISGSGKTVLTHRKLTRFGDKEKPEGIKTGDQIDLLDTPIGLMAIPICLDFCEEGDPFDHLWKELGLEWIFVPACGETTSINAHLRRAQAMLRAHGGVSAVANQHPEGFDQDQGFVCCEVDKKRNGGPPFSGCISVKLGKELEK